MRPKRSAPDQRMTDVPQSPNVPPERDGSGGYRMTPEGGARLDAAVASSSPLAGLRVLVVEDEPGVRHVVSKRIARFGAVVETAADGLEATRRVLDGGGTFDLVLTDLTMPGRSGEAFVRDVRASGSTVPIVVMSGFAAGSSPEDLARIGAQGFLAKPFDAAQLLAALLDSLATRGSRPASGEAASSDPPDRPSP